MDRRKEFFHNLIRDKSMRILELGPLNRPIAEKGLYPNTIYCDIRSTEEVRALYSGNDYLAATGIEIDVETIVPVDHVVKGCYAESFANEEKFDCVIASHVLEHMDDLIFSLRDIAQILKPGGIFYIVYPDKRYCFDHFRTSASFRDAYHVFQQGAKNNAPMVLDFYFSVIPENNPFLFWEKDGLLNELPRAPFANAAAHYERALNGERMEDVHYWPFTDMDFLKFLYDCTRAGLLPFRCISFQPCAQNDQQFLIALQLDPSTLENPERALKDLRKWMSESLPDFYSTKDIELSDSLRQLQEIQMPELRSELERQKSFNGIQAAHVQELEGTIEQIKAHNQEQAARIQRLELDFTQKESEGEAQLIYIQQLEAEAQANRERIAELSTIEHSRIWRMTKPLRWLADKFKGI